MSTQTHPEEPKPKAAAAPTPRQSGQPAYPFAPAEPPLSEAKQKELELEKKYEEYRSKVAESGRAVASFDQLSIQDREEFSSGGKLAAVEVGPAPLGIHAKRSPDGNVVLVDRNDRPLYVAAKSAPKDQPPVTSAPGSFEPIPAGSATPYGNFTIVDGTWAYKGNRLYASAFPVPPADPAYTPALA